MLYRFGLLIARRAKVVLIISALAVVGAAVLGAGAFGKLQAGGFEDPDAESTTGARLIAQNYGGEANLVLLVQAKNSDVDSAQVQQAGKQLTDALAVEPGVIVTGSYFETPIPQLVADDGSFALVLAIIQGDQGEMVTRASDLIPKYSTDNDVVKISGGGLAGVFQDINAHVGSSLVKAELIAIPLTLILLLLAFGSVVAALLPLLIGGIAIVGTFAELYVLGSITDVSVFAINLTTALGLGLGIDYGLLIVARFREQLSAGDDIPEAVARTVATAGRTIAFSAAAVAAALATLLVFPLYFLRSFGYAGIGVVVVAALAGLIVTPAALSLLGTRIDKGKLPFAGTARGSASPFWGRLARTVMKRPILTAAPVLVVLLVAASPILGIKFSLPDETVLRTDATSRNVSDTINAGIPGAGGSNFELVSSVAIDPVALGNYAIALSNVPNVNSVSTSVGLYRSGASGPVNPQDGQLEATNSQLIKVTSSVPVNSAEARDLVDTLRAVPQPPGSPFLLAGTDAALADTLTGIGDALPLALILIAISTFILLFLFTGSLLQPLRALLVNSLSLAAAVGVMIWIFQDGHLLSLLGATPRPMDASMTVLMLCIAFGLSMDYEVFLSSRIKEMHDQGAEIHDAVAGGLSRTGRIVSTAAVLLAVSFFAFGVSTVSMLQLLGLGAGLAVLIDATLVRGVLVPAVMALLGKANFWSPAPLRRIYAKVGLSD